MNIVACFQKDISFLEKEESHAGVNILKSKQDDNSRYTEAVFEQLLYIMYIIIIVNFPTCTFKPGNLCCQIMLFRVLRFFYESCPISTLRVGLSITYLSSKWELNWLLLIDINLVQVLLFS